MRKRKQNKQQTDLDAWVSHRSHIGSILLSHFLFFLLLLWLVVLLLPLLPPLPPALPCLASSPRSPQEPDTRRPATIPPGRKTGREKKGRARSNSRYTKQAQKQIVLLLPRKGGAAPSFSAPAPTAPSPTALFAPFPFLHHKAKEGEGKKRAQGTRQWRRGGAAHAPPRYST